MSFKSPAFLLSLRHLYEGTACESLFSASGDLISYSFSSPAVEDITQYHWNSCGRKIWAVEFCKRNDVEGPFPSLPPSVALLTHATMLLCRS